MAMLGLAIQTMFAELIQRTLSRRRIRKTGKSLGRCCLLRFTAVTNCDSFGR
jgi:hypothetical protein